MNESCVPDERLIRIFREAGQGHVFRWWDEIGADGRARLLAQLRSVDLDQIASLADDVRAGRLGGPQTQPPSREPELPDYVRLPRTSQEKQERAAARQAGEALLRAGKVAAVTVAGGQGTRLGFDAPKGTYPIGPISGKSLFQFHAERILATRRRYGAAVPWYIMTSDATDAATREFFENQRCFGLPPEDVRSFRQRMMPALDRDFRLVLVAKDQILLSPNGHGGTLLALAETGILDDMEARGIEEISYFQVDNPLVRAADPVFIGLHHIARAQMSSKAIRKREPAEPIGAFVRVGGRLVVAEYSDLTPEQTQQRTGDGRLLYGLGSPAIHMIRTDFVRAETAGGFRLPFHLAEKCSPCLDRAGRLVEPEEKNVYKFETFIFDALRDAERSVILETRREEEFSPVKNATGKDSPETCRRDITALCGRRLEKAGAAVPRDAHGQPVHPIEISPLYALDAAALADRLPKRLRLDGPLYLGPEQGA